MRGIRPLPRTGYAHFQRLMELGSLRNRSGRVGVAHALYRPVIGNAAANPKEDKTMKNLTTNMIIAAAALMVTAGMATAQTIKAEVPFSFKANGVAMPAGQYQLARLTPVSGSNIIRVSNPDAHRSILASPIVKNDWARHGDPKLTFECSGAACALLSVDAGEGHSYTFANPKHAEDSRIAVIRAMLVR